uniref:SAM domain-containing protein n=1 Tax=Trichobilharzia regenti TaxID=157069 RepID=A0AA85K725_TRIRE|nr:unnamed protein product [Trichobilharzia regenti]
MSCHISTDSASSFTWDEYLLKTNGRPAKPECFKQSIIPPPNKFEVNTILEAEDHRSAALIMSPLACSPGVTKGRHTKFNGSPLLLGTPSRRSSLDSHSNASFRRFKAASFSLARVVETCGPRLRIRLVGTDDRNDYWFLVDSDQIRPYPSGNPLQPPFGYMHNHLVWNRTLKKATEGTRFADPSWFISQPPDPEDNYFQVNDKLEAVDRRNTQLICPASVGAVHGHHVLINFDGWSGAFDYWARFDSRELFPVGWCKSANYPLQPPGPNVVRSPNNHSTPNLFYAPNFGSLTINDSSKCAYDMHTRTCYRGSKKGKKSLPHKRPGFSNKDKSHAGLIRSGLHKQIENTTPYTHRYSLSKKSSVNNQNSFPLSSSKANSHDISSLMDDENKLANVSVELNATSIDSSIHSLSSPPVIPPVLEDANDSLSLFYSSSPPEHPPCIEFSGSLNDSAAGRHNCVANPSDCVVRLQARPSTLSSISDSQDLVLKSWKVVTETRQRNKRLKLKRCKQTSSKGYDELKQKLKLIKGKTTDPVTRNYDFVDPLSSNLNNLPDLHQNYRNLRVCNNYNSCNYQNTSDSVTYQDDPKSTCTTLYEQDRKNVFKSDVSKQRTPLLDSDIILRTDVSRESIHPSACYFDEINSPLHDNLSVETSDTPSWFSGKVECGSSKSSYPVYTHQNTDSLDNQSCTTHLPSSTVSPSSLDLGSFPYPNPAQWTIEEVYNYITTRDATLLEAAEKFKHHEIDGQALLLVSMESLRNYMKIKLGPALKVVHLINRLKRGLV